MPGEALQITVENVDPGMAQAALDVNVSNRHLRVDTVRSYARDMERGAWSLSPQSVSFNMMGELIDGQHRMAAVVESGATVPMLVVRGVAPSVMKVLDSGIKRTAADFLGMSNVPYRMVLAAIARLTMMYDSKAMANSHRYMISNTEILDFVEANFQDMALTAERATHYRNSIPAAASVIGTAYLKFYRKDPAACSEFFESMSVMSLTGTGDPRLALMRRLSSMRADRTRATQLYVLDLFIRAWNAWRTGEHLTMIPLSAKIQVREVV